MKQVIVIRTKYPDGKGGFFKPRTGKLIAQGAHASMKVFFDRAQVHYPSIRQEADLLRIPLLPGEESWVFGLFTKVCVQVPSEEALLDIVAKAKAAGLPVALIQDAGKTEFGGVPTTTCCAIGPAADADIDLITGSLSLL